MLPTQSIGVNLEYQRYLDSCAKFGYKPSPAECEEIVRYLLLLCGSATTTLAESATEIMEGHGHSDFSILDTIGSISVPQLKLGSYIGYLFKRPRLSALFRQEMQLEFEKLNQWKKLMQLKKKLASAKGENFDSKVDVPTLYQSSSSSSSSPSSSYSSSPAPKKRSSKHH